MAIGIRHTKRVQPGKPYAQGDESRFAERLRSRVEALTRQPKTTPTSPGGLEGEPSSETADRMAATGEVLSAGAGAGAATSSSPFEVRPAGMKPLNEAELAELVGADARRADVDAVALDQWRRLVDVVVSLAGLIVLAPLMIVIAVLIRFDSSGPILYRQRRVGRGGRGFWAYLFRSMYAEPRRPLLQTPRAGVLFRKEQDPRVTRVGRWLRPRHLDELPLFWNVLRGELTLVGPRALALADAFRLAELDPQLLSWRVRVKPGLTGLWQIASRSSGGGFLRMFDVDRVYLSLRSYRLDLRIVFASLWVVLRGLSVGRNLCPIPLEQELTTDPARAPVVPADITPIWTTSPSELRWPLSGPIHFGETAYPLRRPIVGIYETWDGTCWTFRIEAPEPRFLRFGIGAAEEDAYHNWCQELHVDFQRLFHTSPMTMTDPDDQALWRALSELIDVPAYEANRPLTGREVGCLVGTEPGAWTVQWHGRLEKLPLDRMPPEFAMLKRGDWFEAYVVRQAASEQFLKAFNVRPVKSPRPLTPAETADWWRTLPTTADLPPSPRDPTRR